ncbi:hypothetical protein ANO11243_092570 [Dothideomycetidae sp. 11243]|nr:hypothetical protein ANO11243_092570 [fungal sp. No.11243]
MSHRRSSSRYSSSSDHLSSAPGSFSVNTHSTRSSEGYLPTYYDPSAPPVAAPVGTPSSGYSSLLGYYQHSPHQYYSPSVYSQASQSPGYSGASHASSYLLPAATYQDPRVAQQQQNAQMYALQQAEIRRQSAFYHQAIAHQRALADQAMRDWEAAASPAARAQALAVHNAAKVEEERLMQQYRALQYGTTYGQSSTEPAGLPSHWSSSSSSEGEAGPSSGRVKRRSKGKGIARE